jgi:hypothetical protein
MDFLVVVVNSCALLYLLYVVWQLSERLALLEAWEQRCRRYAAEDEYDARRESQERDQGVA